LEVCRREGELGREEEETGSAAAEEEEEEAPPRLACHGMPSLAAEASSTSPVMSEKISPQMESRSALSSADSSAC
jgi:hypothetical protein